MRRKSLAFLCLLVVAVGSLAAARQQVAQRGKISDFMRPKLMYSQRVLEGLALEDYGLIAENARRLTAMSELADWQVLPGLEYSRYSAEFQRLSNQLSRQSQERNLDAATLTYVQLTMTCVECHRHVRQVNKGAAAPPPARKSSKP